MSSILIPANIVARNPAAFADPIRLACDAGSDWDEVFAAVKSHHGPIFRVKDCIGVAVTKRAMLRALKEARASGKVEVSGKSNSPKGFAFSGEDRGWPTTVWMHLADHEETMRRQHISPNFAQLARRAARQRRPEARSVKAALDSALRLPWVVWVVRRDKVLEPYGARDAAGVVTEVAKQAQRGAIGEVVGLYYRRQPRLLPIMLWPYARKNRRGR